MLSWSGTEQGMEVDLVSVQAATGGVAVNFAAELVSFATAATNYDTGDGNDDSALATSREALISTIGLDATIDAAAVIANFEMMTRLADSTGARMPTEVVADRSATATAMGVDKVVSRR
ncbi:MAG: hypothetical protein HQ486_04490 [Acidimicrobiaceae bacterium]|nr:hypothetical protein [Acidimicrobiaceae bacterium]